MMVCRLLEGPFSKRAEEIRGLLIKTRLVCIIEIFIIKILWATYAYNESNFTYILMALKKIMEL